MPSVPVCFNFSLNDFDIRNRRIVEGGTCIFWDFTQQHVYRIMFNSVGKQKEKPPEGFSQHSFSHHLCVSFCCLCIRVCMREFSHCNFHFNKHCFPFYFLFLLFSQASMFVVKLTSCHYPSSSTLSSSTSSLPAQINNSDKNSQQRRWNCLVFAQNARQWVTKKIFF